MVKTTWWAASGSAALLLALGSTHTPAFSAGNPNRPSATWNIQGCSYTATTFGKEATDGGSYDEAVEKFGGAENF